MVFCSPAADTVLAEQRKSMKMRNRKLLAVRFPVACDVFSIVFSTTTDYVTVLVRPVHRFSLNLLYIFHLDSSISMSVKIRTVEELGGEPCTP